MSMRPAHSNRDSGFETDFEALRLLAFRAAYRILGDRDQAEDAAAEALVRTYDKWSKVSKLDYRDAWVMRVAANVAIDVVRKRKDLPEPAASVTQVDQEVATRLTLVSALARLSKRQREVVVMRYLAGLQESEVAEALGMSVNTVKKHASRALAALRAYGFDENAAPEEGSHAVL
jgi:RNA polymerase sigma factor (sigma-70 family)